MPIASDWSDISRVVRENEELRSRLNGQVGAIWANMTKKQKKELKDSALKSKEAFEELINLIKTVEPKPYCFKDDKNGEIFWTGLLATLADKYPFDLSKYSKKTLSLEDAKEVVNKILDQFKDLVENKGLWKELWDEKGSPRKEKAAQRLFFVVAYSYCKSNNLDLTPEADSGNGPVDLKFLMGLIQK